MIKNSFLVLQIFALPHSVQCVGRDFSSRAYDLKYKDVVATLKSGVGGADKLSYHALTVKSVNWFLFYVWILYLNRRIFITKGYIMLRFFKSWLSVNGEGEWKKDDRLKKHARIIQWSEKLTWAYSSGELKLTFKSHHKKKNKKNKLSETTLFSVIEIKLF